jgi:hypothetical protein
LYFKLYIKCLKKDKVGEGIQLAFTI